MAVAKSCNGETIPPCISQEDVNKWSRPVVSVIVPSMVWHTHSSVSAHMVCDTMRYNRERIPHCSNWLSYASVLCAEVLGYLPVWIGGLPAYADCISSGSYVNQYVAG
jgi:hypothetical protein